MRQMAMMNPFIPSVTIAGRPRFWFSGGPLKKAVAALRHAWRAYITYKRLSNLTDEMLAARGLKRGDIGCHAFFDSHDG